MFSLLKGFLKRLVVSFCFFSLFFLLPSGVWAEEDKYFSSDYELLFEVDESGVTRVLETVKLINLTTEYYASSSELTINSTDLGDIEAFDSRGPIRTEVQELNGQTKIKVYFKEKIVGKGEVLVWKLSYQTDEIASFGGGIWEINIPGMVGFDPMNGYRVLLKVPRSFGEPIYIKPEILKPEVKELGDRFVFFWDNSGAFGSGVSLAFGAVRRLNFDLFYHLKNEKLYTVKTEMALPPSTSYQEVFLASIDPGPINVREDEDGNWLALYEIAPNEELKIRVQGKARLFLRPKPADGFEKKDYSQWLKAKKYWETENESLVKKARQLGTIREIYDWVVNNLDYDYSRVENEGGRMGALSVFSNPSSAICLEFSDLFITLARAAGIPARLATGYARSENSRLRPLALEKDILHAWPEYWDEEFGVWRMVDPTWEKTTGGIDYFKTWDFNHFVLAKRGLESDWPYPAGSYKVEGEETKDVILNYDGQEPEPGELETKVKVDFNFPEKIVSGLTAAGEVKIENTGASLVKNIKIEKCGLTVCEEMVVEGAKSLPPFGHRSYKVKLPAQGWFFEGNDRIVVSVNDWRFEKEVLNSSIFKEVWLWAIVIGVSAASGLFGLYSITPKNRSL